MQINPSVRFVYGLIDTAASPENSLVGVLTLGIPTQVAVLTSMFGRLTPSAHRSHISTHSYRSPRSFL
ncbi:hypothetical protein [Streptomyces similanensis]|uniref:Uncharacterized protein n=1 Tax=Streptomyces similanensis TaxID=1274988 RepID=A0ABP9KN80_9ACTN